MSKWTPEGATRMNHREELKGWTCANGHTYKSLTTKGDIHVVVELLPGSAVVHKTASGKLLGKRKVEHRIHPDSDIRLDYNLAFAVMERKGNGQILATADGKALFCEDTLADIKVALKAFREELAEATVAGSTTSEPAQEDEEQVAATVEG